VIIVSGGFASNFGRLRKNWGRDLGLAPQVLLNGSHDAADAAMLDAALKVGAHLTHLDKQWIYAAGVHHPHPEYKDHSLSLIPPNSPLWLNYRGERIGPVPLLEALIS
jgi:predicted oxidoreductase